MPEVAVVHLASASFGRRPFEMFVDSYRRHSACLTHDLIVVFNGFRDSAEVESAGFLEVLADVPHRKMYRHPTDIDLVVYLHLARRLDFAFLCFVNATSEILTDGWLAKLHRHAAQADVGIVGSTGSYETHRDTEARRPGIVGSVGSRLPVGTRRNFPRFPNPHVRTNAFMLSREIAVRLRAPELRTKLDAYRLESGRDSVTAQVRRLGLRALLVGRDGTAYDVQDWPASGTFRSDDQRNLLVADRRTREWEAADASLKARLSTAAWGPDGTRTRHLRPLSR